MRLADMPNIAYRLFDGWIGAQASDLDGRLTEEAAPGPLPVQDEIGYALYLAQLGDKHVRAKPLRGFGPSLLEVLSDYRGDTFRAVYTVRFAENVYVLHVFQKKSETGIETPQREMEVVKERLKWAERLHTQRETQ